MVICLVIAHFTNKSDSPLPQDKPSISQTGKNNQISGRDALNFFGNDALEKILGSHPKTVQVPQAAPFIPRDPDPNPVLEISAYTGSEFLSWSDDGAAWKIDRHGKRMLLVTVSNPLAEDGGAVRKAEKVSVSVSFSYENHFCMDIERAYWLGESSNQVEIVGATKKQVVLGFPKDGEWNSFENAYTLPFSQSWGGGFREWRKAVEKTVPHGDKLDFKVSVLRTKRNGDVATITSKIFKLKILTDTGVWYCEAIQK
jgi:hypothetical protein